MQVFNTGSGELGWAGQLHWHGTHTRARTHTWLRTHKHTDTHSHARTHARARTRAHMHAHAHAHARARTCAHYYTLLCSWCHSWPRYCHSGEARSFPRNPEGGFYQIYQPNKWRLKKEKAEAAAAELAARQLLQPQAVTGSRFVTR